ncbi:hypothetical protein IFM89_025232, partial [Coptis chinensis]
MRRCNPLKKDPTLTKAIAEVWDTRQRTYCNSFDAHEEYISDMTYAADSLKLLRTSGDDTLSVRSLRKNKVLTQSEFSEDEPLSVVLMKELDGFCGAALGFIVSEAITNTWGQGYARNAPRSKYLNVSKPK